MYAVPNSFLDRVNNLETKKHVRTPEGESRFHLPIGSEIVAHLYEAHATAPRARVWRTKKDRNGRDVMTTTHNGVRTELTHLYGKSDYSNTDTYGITVVHTARGDRQLHSDTFTSYDSGLATGHKKAKERALAYTSSVERHVPTMSTRKESTFNQFYQGTYGYEWTIGDEGKHKYDPHSDTSRQWFATKESNRLGITVDSSVYSGELYQADPNAHESVNTIMGVYDDAYPGIAALIPQFIVQPNAFSPIGGATWLAFNRPVYTGKHNENVNLVNSIYHNNHVPTQSGPQHDHTIIVLASEYFGDSYEGSDIYTRIATTYKRATDTGWFSVNAKDIGKETGMENWQAAMLTTLNHEIGHTVARIGFGEMIAQPGEDPKKFQADFWKKMNPILLKHNIVWPGTDIGKSVDTNRNASDPANMTYFKSDVIANTVSQYATKSMHELFAEIWGSYMMDPTPTQFTLEAGKVMEDSLKKYLKSFYR